MITEDYVSYEVAKLLKEKGFNEPLRCWYDNFQNFHEEGVRMRNTDCLPPTIMCPTHQMAMKWLRKTHGIDIVIEISDPSVKDRKYYCMNELEKINKPVNSNLEEAAYEYADRENPTCSCEECLIKTFKAGAQWQKQQDQSTIELAEDHAYLAGQEKIIAKAIKWLEDNIDRYLYNTGGYGEYIPKCGGKMFEDFKKAMEK